MNNTVNTVNTVCRRALRRLAVLVALLVSMPSVALERGWATQLNSTLDTTSVAASAKNEIWLIAAAVVGNTNAWAGVTLSGGQWSVWCSSDGATGLPTDNCSTSHNDALDVSGSGTYNASKFVRAAVGTPHSWIVLKSPAYNGIQYYLLIDWSTASDTTITTAFSKNAMTCAANPCTAATAPTATDIVTFSNATFNVNSIISQNRLHFSLSAAGDFWFAVSRDGAGYVLSTPLIWSFWADFKPVDSYPILYSGFLRTVQGSSLAGNFTECLATAFNNARTATGAAATKVCLTWMAIANNGLMTSIASAMLSSSGTLTGVDAVDSKYDDVPIYVVSTEPSLRGRLVDFRWAPYTLGSGTVGPSVAPYSVMTFVGPANQSLWFPVNTSSVPLL